MRRVVTLGIRRSIGTARTALCRLPPEGPAAALASAASRQQTRSFDSRPRTAKTDAPVVPGGWRGPAATSSSSPVSVTGKTTKIKGEEGGG